MKRVSFKVAKALKEAGYPQGSYCPQYKENGEPENGFTDLGEGCIYAPYYLDVWLWLWREKGIALDPDEVGNDWYIDSAILPMETYPDPEEAIIAAIEYLVNSNLIK